MSTRTWVVMIVVLALNWGGFAAALVYALTRKRDQGPGPPGSLTFSETQDAERMANTEP